MKYKLGEYNKNGSNLAEKCGFIIEDVTEYQKEKIDPLIESCDTYEDLAKMLETLLDRSPFARRFFCILVINYWEILGAL